jgi:signal transduction histidine kinase
MDERSSMVSFPRIRAGWALLGSRAALSWPVPVLAVAFGLIGPLTIDRQRVGGPFVGWLVVALIAQAVLIGVVLACRPLAGRGPWITVLVLAVASACRGLTIAWCAWQLGLTDAPEFGYRVGPAAVAQFGVLIAMALAVSGYARHKSVAAELAAKRAAVAELTVTLRERLDAIRRDLAREVHESIDPLVADLDRELERLEREGDAAHAVDSIRRVVDHDLRPLSHRLADPAVTAHALATAAVTPVLPQVPLPDRLSLHRLIEPTSIGMLAAIVSSSQSQRTPNVLAAFLFPILTGFLTAGLVAGVRIAIGRWTPRLWVGVAVTGLISGVSLSLALGIERSVGLPVPPFVGTAATLVGIIIGVLTAIFIAVDARRLATEQQLRESIDELEELASILRQHAFAARRRLGQILHGSVQGSLYAAAMRLAAERRPTSEDIRIVRADIVSAMARLDEPESSQVLIVDTLTDIAELWDGTCTVRWTLDHRTVRLLAVSPTTAMSVAEIARECVTNAIKHGRATEVWVTITRSGDRVVLSTLDNGTSTAGGESGLGTRLLDETCAVWRREQTDGGTRVTAELAMVRD